MFKVLTFALQPARIPWSPSNASLTCTGIGRAVNMMSLPSATSRGLPAMAMWDGVPLKWNILGWNCRYLFCFSQVTKSQNLSLAW